MDSKGFVCPMHTCATCAVDNIKNPKALKGNHDYLFKIMAVQFISTLYLKTKENVFFITDPSVI